MSMVMGLKSSLATLAIAATLRVLPSAVAVAQPAGTGAPVLPCDSQTGSSPAMNQSPTASSLGPRPRQIHARPEALRFWAGLYPDRVVVTLRDDSGLRLDRIVRTGPAILEGGGSEARRARDVFASATALAGVGGGAPYSLRCPSGQALVGLKVRASSVIDQVRGICTVADGSGSETQSVGGEGGTSSTLRCNDGRVVIGVRGRSSAHVDSLRIECGMPGEQGAPRTTDAAGGSGGAEFGPMRCPRDRIAIGLQGRASANVDSLQLLCSTRPLDAQLAKPWVSRAVGGSGGCIACCRRLALLRRAGGTAGAQFNCTEYPTQLAANGVALRTLHSSGRSS